MYTGTLNGMLLYIPKGHVAISDPDRLIAQASEYSAALMRLWVAAGAFLEIEDAAEPMHRAIELHGMPDYLEGIFDSLPTSALYSSAANVASLLSSHRLIDIYEKFVGLLTGKEPPNDVFRGNFPEAV